jgi:mannosyltransferase OCH1-like enzyme
MLSGNIREKMIYTSADRKNIAIQNMDKIKVQLININRYKLSKKQNFESIIPLKIYQTWHSKTLPRNMLENIKKLRARHPRFEYFLFDDNDCRNFIVQNFDNNVVKAFDSLIPGAYKADLWRYCVLYITGGIYLDIKYYCTNSFRLIELTEKEHWVFDIDGNNIYNALIAVLPGNEILLKCINQVVKNVENKYYGYSCLDPTGPALVAKFLTNEDKKKIELEHMFDRIKGEKFILYKNVAVLRMYPDYYNEHNKYKKVNHYSELWARRRIYK